MARQMTTTEEIKNRLDIVEVIQGYVRLQKAGANFKACCPFHNEKTPSFIVAPERQMWYCFGCGEGGDLFTFIEKIESVKFSDALRLLADKAGVELKADDKKIVSKKKRLFEILELATRFYETQLAESTMGARAKEYLKGRGLTDESIESWRLGWAPDHWSGLYEFLQKKGYSEKDIEEAGIGVRSEKPRGRTRTMHDRFRHRIMFPVANIQGQVIGFSGRLLDTVPARTVPKDQGKYVNTPSTPLYDKSHALYGLDKARGAIKERDLALLVQGNLDVILAHQSGTTNAVASCGTALGGEHLSILKRFAPAV